ncbi:MAG: carboxy terminal-processing peptidase [Akkermansiaceae bacterium]|nr:carboxy terminal-processing peptidase [Verrucomicrobiales bacterium]
MTPQTISRVGVLLLALCFQLSPTFAASSSVGPSDVVTNRPGSLKPTDLYEPASPTFLSTLTNGSSEKLRVGQEEGQIAFWTASLLKNYHYSHHPFDDSISSQFLDRYFESLDPQHLHFIQSDLNQFERYRTNLDNLTLTRSGVGDVSPGIEIFNRFMDRLQQRVAYVDELLKQEKFQFNTDERISVDRRETPYPQDLKEAKALWHQRLRFEYLQEKLGLESKATKAKAPKTEPAKSVHDQIVDTLSHRYHRTLRMFTDWDKNDVLGIYLTALSHVYDPHSDYFNREQLDQFKISMNLQLFGIGAELRSEDGYCKVARLLPGGPAMKSKKINPEDLIVGVAQSNQPPVDVVEMSLTKIVQLIRGPKGTEVRLVLSPAGKKADRMEVTLIRDEIPLEDSAAKGKIIEMPNGKTGNVRLGVINLPSFYAPMMETSPGTIKDALGKYTSVDVAKLLSKFKQEGVGGVILDLRYNGGGSLEEAIRLTGLFIKEGPVVQVKGIDGGIQVDKDTDPGIAYDGPLVVLTSRFSASASEIVAGALQDYGRALIVGDSSTHGKGTVQTVQNLRPLMRLSETDPEPGALKFTIRKFYRASGASTQLKGVMPDIVLPSRLNYSKDIGEAALENPLPWDVIQGAKLEKLNLVQPYLAELMKRSSDRIATNQDFVYVREDIEEYRKAQADKTISLNEKQRLKENTDAEARQKVRDKELRARKDPEEKVYEITLKNADLPGLPPPVQKTNSLAAKTEIQAPGTNDVETAVVKALEADIVEPGQDADAEEKLLAFDWNVANLTEAERILIDYLALFPKRSPMIADQKEVVQ